MTRALGIDVSLWNDNNSTPQMVDFGMARAASARFVFIKASQSVYADPDLLYNWVSARIAGLLRGAYHFLTWDVSGKRQAQYCWSLLRNDAGELPITCDFERWMKPPANAAAILLSFLDEIERLSGRVPMIYTGYYIWREYGTRDTKWKRYPLWLGNYNKEEDVLIPAPWNDWKFWQFTERGPGKVFGCESASVDMNWFAGNEQELKVFSVSGEGGSITPGLREVMITATAGLRVRAEPNLGSAILRVLVYKSRVRVVDVPGIWLKLADEDGYIYAGWTR